MRSTPRRRSVSRTSRRWGYLQWSVASYPDILDIVNQNRHNYIGALISIDSQSEWSDFFLASAGLRHRNLTVQQLLSGGGMHTHSRVSSRIASATQGIELLLERAFDKRTWQLYCALYTVDYVCLGFELPRRCRTHYRVHEARVA